jgi:hypothetical protein
MIDDEDLRALVKAWAEAAGVLNTPVSSALPATINEAGDEIAGLLRSLAEVDAGQVSGTETAENFRKIATAAAKATDAGLDWGKAVEGAGGNTEDFMDILDRISREGMLGPDAREAAGILNDKLIPAYNALGSALVTVERNALGQIAWKTADAQAIQDLADKYGVSVAFIEKELGNQGLSGVAVASSEKVRAGFLDAAAGVDEAGNLISLAATETAAVVEEQTTKIMDALAGAINIFEAPDMDTESLDTYIKRIEEWRDISIDAVDDLLSLQSRGVPPSLLEKLAGDPALAHKFASASAKELKRIVAAYQIHLAAIDSDIMKEGAHQEKKGAGIVGGFAEAMLNAKGLPIAATKKILNEMTAQFLAGNLKPAALSVMATFARGIGQGSGLSEKEATKTAFALQDILNNPRAFNQQGQLMMTYVANGIQKATGLPKSKVSEIMEVLGMTIEGNYAGFKANGYQISQNLADGIRAQAGAAASAGRQLMDELLGALLDKAPGLYTAADRIAAQIAAHLAAGEYHVGGPTGGGGPPTGGNTGGSTGGGRGGTDNPTNGRSTQTIDVTLDRRRFVDQADFQARYRGF